VAVSALALLALPALADDATDFAAALGKAAAGVTVAEAYLSTCDARFPESQRARHDAVAGWAHGVDRASYYRLREAALKRVPGLEADLEKQEARSKALVEEDVAKDSEICSDLGSELNDNALFDIEQPIRYLLRNADDFGIDVAEAGTPVASDSTEVLPLVILSAQLTRKMDEIGSKSGAQENRLLREARESHAEAWLAQRPALLLYSRIIDRDSLREWRGDQQSTFAAKCQSFVDNADLSAMKRDLGQERIVAGEIRAGYARIAMGVCWASVIAAFLSMRPPRRVGPASMTKVPA